MTAAGSILAGMRATAAMLQGIAPNAVYKPADESVTSSTTLQNDDSLLLSLPANSGWMFVLMLGMTGAALGTGDLKGAFTVPSGASVSYGMVSNNTSSGTTAIVGGRNSSGGTILAGIGGAAYTWALAAGSVLTGSTAGTLQFQWAQNTSNATATVVKAGSVLAAWQIS